MNMKARCRFLSAILTLMVLTLPCSNAFAEGEALSKTTGLPVGNGATYRPVIVQTMGAADDALHYNLASADIVYEAIYWAPGWTALMALYNDTVPEQAGPIRGARPYNAEIAAGWGAGYIFWGPTPSLDTALYETLDELAYPDALIGDATRSSGRVGHFFRREGVESPRNAMVNLAQWVEDQWPDGYEPQDPGWLFSDESPSQGEKTAESVAFYFDEEEGRIVFTYNGENGMYERSVGGMWDLDSETTERIRCSNLIVQSTTMKLGKDMPKGQPDDNRNPLTLMDTTGRGTMHAYIGGTCIEGTWKRATPTEPIAYFDEDGEPLVLLPGKTFIELLPVGMFETEVPRWGHDATYTNAGYPLQ